MPYSPSVKESELAQARAAAYGLSAHGFRYPDGETLSTLVDPKQLELKTKKVCAGTPLPVTNSICLVSLLLMVTRRLTS